MKRIARTLVATALVFTACGGTDTDQTTTSQAASSLPPTTATTTLAPPTTASTTTAPPTTTPPTSTTGAPIPAIEVLESYRFAVTVGLTDQPGSGEVRPVHELAGEATTDPEAMRIYGDLRGEAVDLVSDGTRWWDLDELDLELTNSDIELYLGANAFLLPETIAVLLVEEEEWLPAGTEVLREVPTRHVQRLDVKKGRDWGFGNLALLEVWRDELNQIVKLTAWYAVGDNTGFPVATWEITERNPDLEIVIPG